MSEADEVFAEQVARWRAISWRDLQKDLDDAVAYEITGSDGVGYQFEVLCSGTNRGNAPISASC